MAAAAQTGIRLDGLEQITAALRGSERQVNRATRNAVNRTLTKARKRFAEEFYSGTGATKKTFSTRRFNRRVTLTKPKQGETEGRMAASDVTLSLRIYKPKPVAVTHSGTRARVRTQDEYGQPARVSTTVWINPKAVRNGTLPGPMVWIGSDFTSARGPSLAVQLARIAPEIEDELGAFLVTDFQAQFQRQLARGR